MKEMDKACPSGWHIPTKEDYESLVNAAGGESSAAYALKSTKGWDEDGNGSDALGFNALAGGRYDSDYAYLEIGFSTDFWTQIDRAEYSSSLMEFSANNNVNMATGCDFSYIRCVADD